MSKYMAVMMGCVLCAGTASADIKGYCASEWPGDYRMQEHCLEKQRTGNHEMFAFARKHGLVNEDDELSASNKGGPMESILNKCMIEWRLPKFDTYDFRMVMHCVNKQVDAYKRING